jgi:hypothetical protein
MKRLKRRQPASKLRGLVIARDGGCSARVIDHDAGFCRRMADHEIVSARDERYLELDHVNEEPGGQRPTDEAHLVALCQFHHRGGWRDANKEEVRDYLANLYPKEWAMRIARRQPTE